MTRAWNVLGIHPWHAGARLNFLGFTSHCYLSCQDEEKSKCLLWLLHSCIFSHDLLWFLGRRLFLLARVTLAGHVGQSRVLSLWAGCQGWDTQGKFSAMSWPKAPDAVQCDGRSFIHLPYTTKSVTLCQGRETTHEMNILTLSILTLRYCTFWWLAYLLVASILPIPSHLEVKMTVIQMDIKGPHTPVVGKWEVPSSCLSLSSIPSKQKRRCSLLQ